MATVALGQFIEQNGVELLRRCRVKVATRQSPPSTEAEIEGGVPLFLAQLSEQLSHGPSSTNEITEAATKHGQDLLLRGFNLSQVVHGYGDVCQSITDLAVETDAPIGTNDFRTLNRCLDDAIAGAVTEFARGQDVTRDGDSREMGHLITTATSAFELLATGKVGIAGSTGTVVLRSLQAMEALLNRQPVPIAPPATVGNPE
jgi:hypothetical protein